MLTSTAIYIFVTLLSISAYPADCDSWLDYIRNLDSYSGLEGLPAFYAAQHYMGSLGVAILMASLLALVLTSLIGNLWALSRLLCATARDGILPDRFAQLNGKHIPANAMLLVAGISCVIPFVGRTAIGWIVDVTTLGATMLYAFVSAATLKTARKLKKRRETVTGFAGFIVMLVFGIYLLFPNLFGDAMLATETYILFMVWTIIGFFYFRQIIKKDQTRRFGKAIVVWIALLSLVMFMAMIWSGRVDEKATNEAIYAVRDYYVSNADEEVPALEESSFIQDQLDQVHRTNTVNTVLITGLFILALGAMLINHLSMKKWETMAVEERDAARETAFKDPMTGAKSKRAYLIREKELDQAIASGTTLNFAVVVCDVNGLKKINERYGKQYGDSVLGRIGDRIRKVSRDLGGVACRRGADTFFIYCPRRSDYEDILEKLSEGLTGEGNASSNRVRLRMGVYANADKSLEIERRFEYARTAANTVKTGYAKAIGFYDAKMHQANLLRERLLEDFRPSLRAGWFSVYFQPKFDIRPDKPLLSSAEALVRWNHPELGMVSPAIFIPLLEDNGLILELDEFVWRTAAAQIRDWKDRFGFSIPISVNVPRIDMLMPNLKSIFRDILESYWIESKDLLLEITESAYTGDSEQMVQMARESSGAEMGFRIEMDDFGTGYSSLSMLTNLPIDVLKLDMSFVKSAFGEKRDMRMIELIIQIAEHLNIPVIAEGVETEEQYLTLRELGCDFVQGYYFSRPIPAADFERFMAEYADVQKKQAVLST